jgi:long-chain acyl-CoA synthetase
MAETSLVESGAAEESAGGSRGATVLLTGATGFVGSHVARWLLEHTQHTLVALVRAEDVLAAARRLARAWWDWPSLRAAIGGRVTPLCGDVSQPHLGLDEATYAGLLQSVTHIIHAAADLRLDAPLEDLRRTNVEGTAHVLELARAAQRHHPLGRLAHVSTAYVAGGRQGLVPEEAPSDAFGFANAYEQSKYEGECLVQAAGAELPVLVLRPGMVVGDACSGAIKTFNTLYYPLRLYLTGRLRLVPASAGQHVNLVPVDQVAEAIGQLTFDPRATGQTVHLVAPYEAMPTVGELLAFVRAWAQEHLGVVLPRPVYLPLPAAWGPALARRAARLWPRGMAANLATLLPYFSERRHFLSDNAVRLLGHSALRWREVLPPLLQYATDHSFLHRSERTVHEQILFRMASVSRPVTCHDLVEGQVLTRDSAELRSEMLVAAAALRALGVAPGDRVAIAGLNSSRYLTLDVAIGLVGAASVPIYYTSPPGEIANILAASGARLFLVGAPRIVERLGELDATLKVVSFCRAAQVAPAERPVMAWEEFLVLGRAAPAVTLSPVVPEDLATVRYTSGTTGPVKGVCFDQANVRWLAEVLGALHPWRARNRRLRYLSALPMSHVVEGIIAAYAPYYVPAPVDIYFLEDFRALARALPRARPTVFFCVPRFYEKLWAALAANPLGRAYLSAGAGLRRLLRPLVRAATLRRAGLQDCQQLLVGSAPVSDDLLRDLQELGLEVHNAYGLTEAPLVTMNRSRANRVGTVGPPLPATEVRLAEDGEVLVRGPQVMRGYLDPALPPPFRDGWLLTGDLGALEGDHLRLRGRKKELLVTAYGKKLYPARVEELLKEIPGVEEALLVGDGRPFCAALLWVRRDGDAAERAAAVARGIAGMNQRLAHPEQVKRWALLENDLSVERGDLTANLKLKRQRALQRLADVVEACYGGPEPRSPGVLGLGAEEAQG